MLDRWSIALIVAVTVGIASVVAFVAVASGRAPLWNALVLLAGYAASIAAMWRANYLNGLLFNEYNRQAAPEDRIAPFAHSWTLWEARGRVRRALSHTDLPRRCTVAEWTTVVTFVITAVLFMVLGPGGGR